VNAQQIASELEQRIEADIAHFGGVLPVPYAIAWRGYLAGLLEWGVLDVAAYDGVLELLPAVSDDPAVAILRGRD
jgi:hypothetical protein